MCRQMRSGSFGILSTNYSLVNLSFNVYKLSLALNGLQGFLCHKTNQTKLENILSLPKNLTFSLKSDQTNLFTNI